ncbi:unnamed protein product [Gongylonema pulchrum]|uniref:CMD domain-containing protein n=1 Tax=Gongylonema pulchrum TaxID=637853 RepID=A0A183ELJ1_9BILA|nr:unnamed protein product [Gongylonema pulchrum]
MQSKEHCYKYEIEWKYERFVTHFQCDPKRYPVISVHNFDNIGDFYAFLLCSGIAREKMRIVERMLIVRMKNNVSELSFDLHRDLGNFKDTRSEVTISLIRQAAKLKLCMDILNLRTILIQPGGEISGTQT